MKDQSWSIVGGPPELPEIGKPSYDVARKVLTVPVRLAAGRAYRLGLNGPGFENFRSADGVPLGAVEFSFRTRE